MPYQISTQRGELSYALTIDQPRSLPMDAAARAVAVAFEAVSGSDPSYGGESATSSITFTSSTTTTTTDTVPLTV